MKPPHLSFIAVSALLCVTHATAFAAGDANLQTVLDVPPVLAQQSIQQQHKLDLDHYLFPSEVNALETHEEYELLRIMLPARDDEQTTSSDIEVSLLRAAGMPDMRSYISHMAQLLSLDIWQASSTHLDILVPSSTIKHQLLSALPLQYSTSAQIIISSFPELYEAHAREVASLADTLEGSEMGMDVLMKGRNKKGKKGKHHRGGGKKHRKKPRKPSPNPSPDPNPRPPTHPSPPRTPPPPPPGSNRTTPDIYNTTDIHTLFHDAYHPLSVLYDFQDELVATFGDAVGVFSLGMSAEGREIKGLKIHKKRNETAHAEVLRGMADEGKGTQRQVRGKGRNGSNGLLQDERVKEFYIQGGQHAREWVSPATVLYFAHHLLVAAFIEENKQAIDLLERYQFTLVPTINPDGYVYSQEHSRLWKKNRQDLEFHNCRGIDMNSNWGYQWSPASPLLSNPCSESYPGSRAFEAVETQLVADYLQSTPNNVRAFVDVHSYGQLFMFPYSYSCSDFPKDAETLMEAGLGVARALKAIHGTVYQAGQACDLIYRMAGDAIDWSYATAGIEWSYSAELRDTGTYGFLLPGSLIRPSAEEITAGLVYLAQFILTLESPS